MTEDEQVQQLQRELARAVEKNDKLVAVVRAMDDLLFHETGKTIDEVKHLVDENDRWRKAFNEMIAKLEAGQHTVHSAFCSYCRERWPQLDGETVDEAIAHARAHADACPKHPMRAKDVAVERLLFALHVYGGDGRGRGARGCMFDAIQALAPVIADELREGDADDVYDRHFDPETTLPKRPVR